MLGHDIHSFLVRKDLREVLRGLERLREELAAPTLGEQRQAFRDSLEACGE
jgi:hypothetical protein